VPIMLCVSPPLPSFLASSAAPSDCIHAQCQAQSHVPKI
jgi:hypothetical protein